MGFIRPSVLLFALVMTAPAIYRYATDDLDLTSVLARYLIAVPVAVVLLAGLRFVTAAYSAKDDDESEESTESATPAEMQPAPPS